MNASSPEPIAIVGSGCRFPGGASSPSALWKLLEKPRDVGKRIPADRFNPDAFFHPNGARHGTANVRHTYLLDQDIRVFDAGFFNISPNEADSIDPQQRLLMETVYEALETGGHKLESMRGSDTAVYVGTMNADYHDKVMKDMNTIQTYAATGINRAIISNRVSYFFDWHGPSMTIDTACSSSLIAVHQGVRALRSGESRVALACGTQVILGHETYITESKLKMLSPNGKSRMWDEAADGYARGEGVAAVVLKRLSDAIADGDRIECLIRETGANQDGFSNGLTVPNSAAQATLIRQTYKRAGLDPENKPEDRPQYFEAHGTGTQAGDPKEAAAIYDTFGKHIHAAEGTPLYVGSVKTVVGHLEGSAGLAGVLKASASIQHGVIPPNLLFNRLSPKVEPFYKGLKVPTSLTTWPELPEGAPRRASVNSFGFGGANAHAILEQYIPPVSSKEESTKVAVNYNPFVFSAFNETALVSLLQKYSGFLKEHHDEIDAADLAWTLAEHRSQFVSKAAFAAESLEQLSANIDKKLADVKEKSGSTVGTRFSGKEAPTPRILGVFTGQGAQWPTMGAQLIRSSNFVRQRLEELQKSLDTLPAAERPAWKIVDELLAGADTSRITEAALSQPLCTAVQVVLVDLLKSTGINFSAVVGHSSGEIGAAYAAGFINAHDAIRIAHLRGLYAKLACNKDGQKGAMLAVGTSWEDAQELINQDTLKGKLSIAAENSSASLTLSGDVDAVTEAKKTFDEAKKFARLLKVDTAYHSHHMLPCSEPYVASLQAAGIKINHDRGIDACAWYSSVVPEDQPMEAVDELQDTYWRDNMTGTVFFADAVKNAIFADDEINLVLEVGPHPALKGPAMQNISDILPNPVPYSGVLSRSNNDVTAFADALGFVWSIFGSKSVDLQTFEKKVTGNPSPSHQLLVDLPSYPWNHERIHWYESRKSRQARQNTHAPHDLLGTISPDSNPHDMRWSNIIKESEIPWLKGHKLQGITVFPAAGYVVMALEAARIAAGDREVELYELLDLSIPKAITLEDGDTQGIETLVTLSGIEYTAHSITGKFVLYSTPVVSIGSDHKMDLVTTGTVKISLGTPNTQALSGVPGDASEMTSTDGERFYNSLSKLGYGYSGPFQGMTGMKRRLGKATALLDTFEYPDDGATNVFMVHPSTLDVSFQSSFLAYSAPGDDQLWSVCVPTSIRSIRVNPKVCASIPTFEKVQLPVWTTVESSDDSFSACLDIFGTDTDQNMLQIEDVAVQPFAPATKLDDRSMFSSMTYCAGVPTGPVNWSHRCATPEESARIAAGERIAYHYMRNWKKDLMDDEWAKGKPHHAHLQEFVNYTLEEAAKGGHAVLKAEWANDTDEEIEALIAQYADEVEFKLLKAVGEHIPATVRGKTTILEHMTKDNMLNDYYTHATGFEKCYTFLEDVMKNLTHRYPNTKVLEIGAGTGGATERIFGTVADKLSTYTYTDISVGFFGQAEEKFKEYSDKIVYKAYDVEASLEDQGFEPYSYDAVVAANVLHATVSLEQTLQNARRLVKPGGYLILLETITDSVRIGTIMGGLSGWWLGVDDGRKYGPLATTKQWDSALRNSGFSGIDYITPQIGFNLSVLVSQAVDESIDFLRDPLAMEPSPVYIENLVILGTETEQTATIAKELSESLGPFCGTITVLPSLPTEADATTLHHDSTFVNLVDLGSPIFKTMTPEKMAGLKLIVDMAQNILWITCGALVNEPYHSASIAFGRTIGNEAAHISINFLDLDKLDGSASKNIAEQVLRQYALGEWDTDDIMWSNEREIHLIDGRMIIPRLIHDVERNNRFNSLKRDIPKSLSVAQSNYFISQKGSGSAPSLIEDPNVFLDNYKSLAIVEASSFQALRVAPETYLYLSIGRNGANEYVAMLADKNCNSPTPVASVPVDVSSASANSLLVAMASEFLAESVLDNLPSEGSILVNCSANDHFTAAALVRRAPSRLHFTFVSTDESEDGSWIKLSTRAPAHLFRTVLSAAKPTHFFDLTATSRIQLSELGQKIVETLPASCRHTDACNLFQRTAAVPLSSDQEKIASRLAQVAAAAVPTTQDQVQDVVVQLSQIHDMPATSLHAAATTVQWPLDGRIDANVANLDARRLFSKDKTYVLVGLSGEMGQSLCKWMVTNGAGCVCLTSRSPNISQKWLDSFKNTGATVKAIAMDVTDKDVLNAALDEIRATCPPIAGVANGAMILRDTPFEAMPYESMREVLRPKIDGSNNLDQAFYNDNLDFFVMFSSVAVPMGNRAQANYVAANAYMQGLARQRRSRGLAASAMDISFVVGIGVVETMNAVQFQALRMESMGLRVVSETDLQLAFGETIQAGYVRDEDNDGIPNAIITTGIRPLDADTESDVFWFSNPLFAHCAIESSGGGSAASRGGRKEDSIPVAEQIAGSANKEQGLQALKDSFASKIRAILHIGDQEIEYDSPLVNFGLDSLVAVEVRSWFLKELRADVPVLMIISGSTLSEVCEAAMKKLPQDLVERIGSGAPAPAAKEKESPKLSLRKLRKHTPPSSSHSGPGSDHSASPKDGDMTPESSVAMLSLSSSAKPSGTVTPATPASEVPPAKVFLKSEQISLGQSSFWSFRFLSKNLTAFNVLQRHRFKGNLRIGDLERAVRIAATRHEALRTVLIGDENQDEPEIGYQEIMTSSLIRLEYTRVNSLEEVSDEYNKLQVHNFDLASGKSLRLLLVSLSPSLHYLLVAYHGIIMDDTSYQIFLSDVQKAYGNQHLGLVPRQYSDFAAAQRDALERGEMKHEIEYWQEVFPENSLPPALPLLPMARRNSRPMHSAHDFHQAEAKLPSALISHIRLFSAAQKVTPFDFFLAVFKIMLFFFIGVQDLAIGIGDTGRGDEDLTNSVGLFSNFLALRFRRQPRQTFMNALVEAHNTTAAALENSRLPFEVLLQHLGLMRSSSHSPLFQAFFDYRQDQKTTAWCGCEMETEEFRPARGLYDQTAANLLLETYMHLVECLGGDASLSLENTPLFDDSQLFHAIEAGRVYVPLDIEASSETLVDAIKGFRPRAILADSKTLDKVLQPKVDTIIDVSSTPTKPSIKVPNSAEPGCPAVALPTSCSMGNGDGIVMSHSGLRNEIEGYIKTSRLGAERVLQQGAFTWEGSLNQIFTGLATGGMVYVVPRSERRDPLSITEIVRDKSLTYTHATSLEYWLWMRLGGDALQQASSWRHAFASGKSLASDVVKQFAELGLPQLRVYNAYGRAEVSIGSHTMEVDYHGEGCEEQQGSAPCGYSLPNYSTYILDEMRRPLPVGMPGEVFIGGAGVSPGYVADEELTESRFMTDLYATSQYVGSFWCRMYRTGDIGYLRVDGSLVLC